MVFPFYCSRYGQAISYYDVSCNQEDWEASRPGNDALDALSSSLRYITERETASDYNGKMEYSQVVNAAEIVAYQTASVVSRQVLGKPTGTVTLFAFDAGQGLSEHTAPFDALVAILDGAAEVTIAGQAFQLAQGEMILMPANQPHALTAKQPFKMMLIMIRS